MLLERFLQSFQRLYFVTLVRVLCMSKWRSLDSEAARFALSMF